MTTLAAGSSPSLSADRPMPGACPRAARVRRSPASAGLSLPRLAAALHLLAGGLGLAGIVYALVALPGLVD